MAICRDLPDSFGRAVTMHPAEVPQASVSLEVARRQHRDYVACLRKYLPTLCLPALESHPDCLFVEDAVVAVGRRAVMTRPGHVSRRGEVASVRRVLEQLGVEVVADLSASDDGDVRCDGGDVLYTGRHLFVGLSSRTNRAAYEVLRAAFPDVEVVPVALPPPPSPSEDPPHSPVLHLKSAVTHLDVRTLVAPTGSWGDALLLSLGAEERGYAALRLPDMLSCNAVVLKDRHIVAQNSPCAASRQALRAAARERDMTIDFVNTSELAKKDAALTCCSVLLETSG